MEIKTLKGTDIDNIVRVFNLSFSDYFIAIKLTTKQLAAKMKADKTDLNLSVGVFEQGELIAFILHGFDIIENQKVVYNGGTGVIPNKRSAGLTKEMYHFILPLLKDNGINRIVLEVVDRNIQAIKSYKKSGFKVKRELVCYKGTVENLATNGDLEITKLSNYDWKLMETFWDINPTWQNSKNVTTQLIDDNISIGAYIKNQLVGYVVFNPNNNRIQQLAVHKDFRNTRIASTLICELTANHGNTISVINVDKTSKSMNRFFRKIGLENNLEQLEMELKLV